METNEREKPKKKRNSVLLGGLNLLIKIGWIALAVFIVFTFVIGVKVNSGIKMEPSFNDRDIVFFSRFAKDIAAGDTVVFRTKSGKTETGRIVAVSGDAVDINEAGFKLNGYYQTESYAKGVTVLFEDSVDFPIRLSDGEYFILFDNRSCGGDSRSIGIITSDDVLGRVFMSIRTRDF